MKLRDFLASFEGLDPDAEVYVAGNDMGDVHIYVGWNEVWTS